MNKNIFIFLIQEKPETHELYVAYLKDGKNDFSLPYGKAEKNESETSAAHRIAKEYIGNSSDISVVENIGEKQDTLVFLVWVKNQSDQPNRTIVWFDYESAKNKISETKDIILRARQVFYYKKSDDNISAHSLMVAIPTYNGMSTIGKTIDSAIISLNELPEYISKELIVCTDYCTDNTDSIVESIFRKGHPNIKMRLIKNKGRKGKSDTLNTIFDASTSQLMWLVDDDVLLDRHCISKLIDALIREPNIKCFFCKWIRTPGKDKSFYRRFWHEILGVKFDVQPYKKPSEYLLGGSVLIRREDYVRFPWYISNEDQFLQYIYWPKTKKINEAFLHFNSVDSLSDYYRRFIRIMGSSVQLGEEFSKNRVHQCSSDLRREIDYKKVFAFPLYQLSLFMVYRLIRLFINWFVSLRLLINKEYVWNRVKQNP